MGWVVGCCFGGLSRPEAGHDQEVPGDPHPCRTRGARAAAGAGQSRCLQIKHAQILLKADEAEGGPGWPDARIAEAFAAGITTVERVRRRFVEEGFASALSPYRGGKRIYERKLDGAQEAHLIALACSAPPDGQARWTLRLLAQHMVELAYVDMLSYETVRQTLKKERPPA